MRIKDYLNIVGAMLEKAEDSGDIEDCKRLAFLIIDTAKEYIKKVDKSYDNPRTTTDSTEVS